MNAKTRMKKVTLIHNQVTYWNLSNILYVRAGTSSKDLLKTDWRLP